MKQYKVYLSVIVLADTKEEAIEKAANQFMPEDILDFESLLGAEEVLEK